MKIFNLPDLGEGLADAEIHEWHVKVGDVVKVDQPLVCMETAKAVVEVPSPQAGRIKKLYGKVGDVIDTGAPLVEFEMGDETSPRQDGGSVVGSLEESSQRLEEGNIIIGAATQNKSTVKAMPAVRSLAKQLQVDLALVTPTGPQGAITAEDVINFSKNASAAPVSQAMQGGSIEKITGVRRAMAVAMTQSHQEVVPVTIFEDADITNLSAKGDITTHIIQAIIAGIQTEPALNAWYNSKTMERHLFEEINIGLAMDTKDGLFVPVIKNVAKGSPKEWRAAIDAFKKSVNDRTVPPSELQGATLTLTNFGMFAGRYATPIIVPPMVAILGCGKWRDAVVAHQGKAEIRRILPLSLTFDHRAVTGGEATRFLAAVIKAIENK
jgi:pyruvate dehydrogenase E2 component (dihydrolipoamide acetyltransferase)